MVLVTVHSDSGAQENIVSHCFHCIPIYLPWGDGTGNINTFFPQKGKKEENYWCSGTLQENMKWKRVTHCFLGAIKSYNYDLCSPVLLKNYFPVIHGKKSMSTVKAIHNLVLSYLSGLLVCPCSPTQKSADSVMVSWTVIFITSHFFNIQFSVPQMPFPDKYLVFLWSESEDTQLCPTLHSPVDYKPSRLLQPWDFPGENTGVGCPFLLQGIFLTKGSNPALPHCRQTLYGLSHQGISSLL